MKILLMNKYLYPRGGAETYVLELGKLLRDKGHEVEYFGMADEKNMVSNRIDALVSPMDFSRGLRKNPLAPFRLIYSGHARRALRRILTDFQPDVIHLNNIYYHLSPSVLLESAAYRRKAGKPVQILLTAHDYQTVCPNYKLLDGRGRLCEKCSSGNYLHCIRNRCVHHSMARSILAAAEGFVWRCIPAYRQVDRVICCSDFLKSKLEHRREFREKCVMIHNFAPEVTQTEVPPDDYILYFGRFAPEKGMDTLLEAAAQMPDLSFLLAGSGELPEQLPVNVCPVGHKSGEELEKLIRAAKITVCPSRWYENSPFSVIESLRYGTPVVASRIGGIPELVRDGETGLLFTPGDAEDLERKIRTLWGDASRYRENCARAELETRDTYYEKLIALYRGETDRWREN